MTKPERASAAGGEGFDAAAAARGLTLAADDRPGIEALADWLAGAAARLETPADPISPPAAPVSPVDDPAGLPIAEAATRLRDGRLSAVQLVEAHLARIDRDDLTYRAFYTILADAALAAAARADAELAAGRDRGPLHGIPVGLKDLIDVAGLRTTAGSRGRANAIAVDNAAIVDRLVAGGAVILGKLATYEFATVGPAFDTLFPPARNPWQTDHITGGSSSGCAAAVAGGLLRTSIGTDTGGSVRSPASYCGVVGLKPTRGSVPETGIVPLSPGLDTVGAISATVAEAAITLDVIAGRLGTPVAASAELGQGVEGLRIGYARNWFVHDPEVLPAIVTALDAAASQLSLLGATVEEVDLPDYDLFEAAGAVILHAEAFDQHAPNLRAHRDWYGRQTYQTLAAGLMLTPAQLAAARRTGAELTAQLDATVFAQYDAVLTASTLTTALRFAAFGDKAVWTPMRTIAFNVTGHPALALPIGLADGLPMGLQLVGRAFGEKTICRIGDAYERATDFVALRPPAPRPD